MPKNKLKGKYKYGHINPVPWQRWQPLVERRSGRMDVHLSPCYFKCPVSIGLPSGVFPRHMFPSCNTRMEPFKHQWHPQTLISPWTDQRQERRQTRLLGRGVRGSLLQSSIPFWSLASLMLVRTTAAWNKVLGTFGSMQIKPIWLKFKRKLFSLLILMYGFHVAL